MVYTRDVRCGALNIEVNSNWVHTAINEMGYKDKEDEDDDWEWKFERYCEDMELEIYRENSGHNYNGWDWSEWFLDNMTAFEYFDELFVYVDDDE